MKTQIIENITESDLAPIRQNMFAILDAFPNEADYVQQMLVKGWIDGSDYNPSNSCSCLFGTIARKQVRGDRWAAVTAMRFIDRDHPIFPFHGSAEICFMKIRPSDTPANNKHAAIAYLLIEEWQAGK